MSSFAASITERFPNIAQFITGQVHHGAASKEQRLKTRDAVVEHIQKQLRERVSTYVGWVKAGSQANHLCVRGKRPDFDILFVVGDQRLTLDELNKMFAAKRKASWTFGASVQTPAWYLAQVEQSAQSYARLGAQNQKAIEIQRPAVYMCSSDTDFDLLPALRVCLPDGSALDGLYLIPSTNKDDAGWTLSFTGREKARFKELEAALPGVRDAIKILKYLNQTQQWSVPSIAITSVVWHASEALRIYQWPRTPASVSWDKVRVLRNLLLAALQTGRVTHMFKTGENVLDGVDIPAAIRAVQACTI